MSPEPEDWVSGDEEEREEPPSPTSPKAETAPPGQSTKPPVKRRTKTGCLTCRKRRIKCGEERPVCKNCIKSKRDCAGYAPPAGHRQHEQLAAPVIGDPASGYPSDPYGLPQSQSMYDPQYQYPQAGMYTESSDMGMQSGIRYGSGPGPGPTHPSNFGYVFQDAQQHQQQHPTQSTYAVTATDWNGPMPPTTALSAFDATSFSSQVSPPYTMSTHDSNSAQPEGQNLFEYQSARTTSDMPPTRHASWSPDRNAPYPTPVSSIATDQGHHWTLPRPIPTEPASHSQHVKDHNGPGTADSSGLPASQPPASPPTNVAEDDLYDTRMDDEIEATMTMAEAEDTMDIITDRQTSRTIDGRKRKQSVRPRVPPMLSLFRDDKNKELLCNFLRISPTYTVWERNYNNDLTQTLWPKKLALLAMSHPALAHTILAVSAFERVRVNQEPVEVATKHYQHALQRIGRLLSLPQRRVQTATLATIALLAIFELQVGDHSRWFLHVDATAKLLQEYDYAGGTRVIRRMREQAKLRIRQVAERYALTDENYLRTAAVPEALLNDVDWDVDSNLVSQLSGFPVDYDNQMQPNFTRPRHLPDMSERDVEDYKTRMDLRWFSIKEYMLTSFLNGDPPSLPVNQWIYCPPRGPLGRLEVPHATMDHLLLVLGRLIHFGAADRARKIRVAALTGGQWVPPPGFLDPPSKSPTGLGSNHSSTTPSKSNTGVSSAPSANEGRVRQSKPAGVPILQESISAANLTPIPPVAGPIPVLPSFETMTANINDQGFVEPVENKSSVEPMTLEQETEQALAEYARITAAFDLFERLMGPAFQPLPQDDSLTGPFGPVMRYRVPSIANIWLHYYCGLIMLKRLHPHMPVTATVAAGVAAPFCVEYAQTIGKISSGLRHPNEYRASSNPEAVLMIAGLTQEATMPLSTACPMYLDPKQRAWMIDFLVIPDKEIGWKTALYAASLCEVVWMIMAEKGHGPPYKKVVYDPDDPRLSGAWYFDKQYKEETPVVEDAVEEHESRYVRHDRRVVGNYKDTRAHWAVGLLGMEEDMAKLAIDNKNSK